MSTAADAAPDRFRWTIGLLLAIGVLVNYFDRVNIAVAHQGLVDTFGIGPAMFGYLSAAYSWTYAACQIPMGKVLDRVGVRRVSLWSISLWGIASLASAVAPGVFLFFTARLLLGIGEAPSFPANAKAVGAWFPRSERSMATAIFDSSAKFGSAFGVPLIGLLLLRVGWRYSFAATAGLSFLYLGLFALIYREPSRFSFRNVISIDRSKNPKTTSEIPEALLLQVAPPTPLRRLILEPKVLGTAIGFGSYNYVFFLLLTWLPTYLITSLHTTARDSFLFTGAPWLLAGVAELLIGGFVTDTLIRRGLDSSRVRQAVLITGMTCGLGIFGAAYAHTVQQALLWISLSIGGLSIAAAVGWSLPALIVPNTSTGSVGGIVNFSNQLSALAAPMITGYTVQHTGKFFWAFAIAAGYLIVGICAYIFLLRRIEPIDVRHALAGTDLTANP